MADYYGIIPGKVFYLRGRNGKFTLLTASHHLSDGFSDSCARNSPCHPPPQQYLEWLCDGDLISIYSHPAKHAALSKKPVKAKCIFSTTSPNHNAGSLNAEEFFQQLVAFARSLNEEDQRGVGEQLNEEELALFDLLTRSQIEMSETDRERVKAIARELLATLKAGKLVLDWRKRQQARAEVGVTIEKLLDQGLPRGYTPELFELKTTAVFQHVYDAYYGAGRSVYAAA